MSLAESYAILSVQILLYLLTKRSNLSGIPDPGRPEGD